MTRRIDHTGERFCRLLVIESAPSSLRASGQKQSMWRVRCDCGTLRTVKGTDLRTGNTRSCGCLFRDVGGNHKHGFSRTTVHKIWLGMRRRCLNKNDSSFQGYGGRGITICERWSDFATFYTDMGEPPEGASIERIDNNAGYSPANCKWATRAEQCRNRRSNLYITIEGRTQCLLDWSRELGIDYSAVRMRIRRLKWEPQRALLTPIKRHRPRGLSHTTQAADINQVT